MLNEKKRFWLSLIFIFIGIIIMDIGLREQIYGSEDMERAKYSDDDFASNLEKGEERSKWGGFIYAIGIGLCWGGITGVAFILYNKIEKLKKTKT